MDFVHLQCQTTKVADNCVEEDLVDQEGKKHGTVVSKNSGDEMTIVSTVASPACDT